MALAVLEFAGVAWLAADRGPPAPTLPGGQVEVPLFVVGGLPVVEVGLCGRDPVRFLLDTGTSMDGRVDRALAVDLGLLVSGRAIDGDGTGENARETPVVRVPELRVGPAVFPDRRLLADDYSRRADGVRGILGFGLFEGLCLTIDGPALRVILSEAAPIETGARAVVPYASPRGVPEVRIRLGEREVPMLLDTGADAGLLLPLASRTRVRTLGPIREAGVGRTSHNVFPVSAGVLAADLEIGDIVVRHPYARFAGPLRHAILGYEILARHRVVFDVAAERMVVY